MDKKELSERDICSKFITPSILKAGWDQNQFREEVKLTDGRVAVRDKMAARIKNPDAKGGPKRADYVLYARPNLAIAVVEAKQNKFSLGHGMQQALGYAEMLDAPFALSSNGDGFLLHDRTGLTQPVERPLSLDEFPCLDILWPLYWPIYNLDLKKPNAPEEESHDPGVLPEKYKKLLGGIEETENRLKSVLASALAHHFTDEAFL